MDVLENAMITDCATSVKWNHGMKKKKERREEEGVFYNCYRNQDQEDVQSFRLKVGIEKSKRGLTTKIGLWSLLYKFKCVLRPFGFLKNSDNL